MGVHAGTPDAHCAGRNRWRVARGYSRHGVGGRSQGEQALVDCRSGMLDHEQRGILENIAVVQPIAATEDVLALTCKVVGETYARTEVLVIVMRQFCEG